MKKIIAPVTAIMRCKECKRRYKKGKKQVDANTAAVVNGDSGVRKLTGSGGNKPEKRRSGGGGKKVSFKTNSGKTVTFTRRTSK